jgi:hypothetical protein
MSNTIPLEEAARRNSHPGMPPYQPAAIGWIQFSEGSSETIHGVYATIAEHAAVGRVIVEGNRYWIPTSGN